jgi:hypothetical protein
MNKEILTEDNFVLFCATHYKDIAFADDEDFNEDLNRIKYIKKLITRYVDNKKLKERLILNHIIILNNCLGPEILCKVLYLKLKPYMEYIKPFLVLLDLAQEKIYNVGNENIIDLRLIKMNEDVVSKLREI